MLATGGKWPQTVVRHSGSARFLRTKAAEYTSGITLQVDGS